jgi:hypothetical protein
MISGKTCALEMQSSLITSCVSSFYLNIRIAALMQGLKEESAQIASLTASAIMAARRTTVTEASTIARAELQSGIPS